MAPVRHFSCSGILCSDICRVSILFLHLLSPQSMHIQWRLPGTLKCTWSWRYFSLYCSLFTLCWWGSEPLDCIQATAMQRLWFPLHRNKNDATKILEYPALHGLLNRSCVQYISGTSAHQWFIGIIISQACTDKLSDQHLEYIMLPGTANTV